jgi:Asp-tRNA(Asn)/Glu-tRNA(Gln) amidotransferase A subunit family amidase
VPTDRVIPLSTSFDHVGPIALTVADAALLWAVLANDPRPTCAPARSEDASPRSIARLFRFTRGA